MANRDQLFQRRESLMSRRRFLSTTAAAAGVVALAACQTATSGKGRPSTSYAPRTSATTPTMRTPAAPGGIRWPGEWEPHEATMMSMPRSPVIYVNGARLAQVQKEWASVANAISEFEPVVMVIPPGDEGQRLKPMFSSNVETLPFDYDDGWLRDNGPIVIFDPTDSGSPDARVGLDFNFNGWGGAFDKWGQTWHRDDALPADLCEAVGIASRPVDFVLEGGALQGDGAGVLMTTEECLLNPNRNLGMSKEQVEATLLETFNASNVIWLPYGLIGDLTSGHVDGVAMFIGPGHVIAQTTRKSGQERDRLQANLDVLRSSTDASGNPLKIDELPLLPVGRFGGLAKVSFTYVNFGFTNGGLVVGTTGVPRLDRQGLAMMRDFVPDREVVGVPVPTINWAGGGVHCITQALPAAP